jgi:hypothetical protein
MQETEGRELITVYLPLSILLYTVKAMQQSGDKAQGLETVLVFVRRSQAQAQNQPEHG